MAIFGRIRIEKLVTSLLLFTLFLPMENAKSVENWVVRWQVLDLSVWPQFTNEPIMPIMPSGRIALPLCSAEIISDCIEGLSYTNEFGATQEGIFESYVPITYKLSAPLPNTNVMRETIKYGPAQLSKFSAGSVSLDAGQSGLWSFGNVSHSGGKIFQVTVGTDFTINQKGVGLDFSNFRASITPIKQTLDNFNSSQANNFFTNGDVRPGNFNSNEEWVCFFDREVQQKYCQEKAEFTELGTFKIRIRLRAVPSVTDAYPWLLARATSATIEARKLGGNVTLLELSAAPVVVTEAEINYPGTLENYALGRKIKNLTNQDLGNTERFDESDFSGYSDTRGFANGTNRSAFRLWTYSAGSSEDGFYLWKNSEGRLPEPKPTSNRTMWNFSPINKYFPRESEIRKCSVPNIPNGLISSNATVVRPNPPSWNSTEKTLEFEIASPHFELDGKVKSGYYAVAVEENVARCLWGQEISAAKATVTILPADGSASTIINTEVTKSSNGYFQFFATGFHYSANKVAIKLEKSEEKAALEKAALEKAALEKAALEKAALEKAALEKAALKKTSITCVKGKVLKKVTAVNPKCPSGYKKK
jgi:hypothetical protein